MLIKTQHKKTHKITYTFTLTKLRFTTVKNGLLLKE